MDRKLIQETIDRLKDERSVFNMAHWLNTVEDENYAINWCKTAGCIAGQFACIKKVDIMKDHTGRPSQTPGRLAAELADLDPNWAIKNLFVPMSVDSDGYYTREWHLRQITKEHAIDALENLLSFDDADYRNMNVEDIWIKYCEDYEPCDR